MAKRTEHHHPGETLEQIESAGDRMATWVGENPVLILGTALGILVIAAGYGLASSLNESSRMEASDALSTLQTSYRVSMGADVDSIEVPEPANPETARAVREEYVANFRELAEEHAGTVAADLAWMEVGSIEVALGSPDAAIATWAGAAETASGETTRALLLSRIAVLQEDQERWLEAAEAYEAASQITSYPLRYSALADAARCYAEAEEVDRAIAALEIVELEAPDQSIPEHTRLRVAELRAGRSDG